MQKFIGIGRITKQIELRYTQSNLAVAQFTLAINRNFKKEDGTQECDFIQCVAWRKIAENMSKYTSKGSKIAVEGVVQTRSYDASDGSKRYITEIICNNVEFLDTKKEKQQNAYQEPQQRNQQFQQAQQRQNVDDNNPFSNAATITVNDEDIPF